MPRHLTGASWGGAGKLKARSNATNTHKGLVRLPVGLHLKSWDAVEIPFLSSSANTLAFFWALCISLGIQKEVSVTIFCQLTNAGNVIGVKFLTDCA